MSGMPLFRYCVLTAIVLVSTHAVAVQPPSTITSVKLSIPASNLSVAEQAQVNQPVISIIIDDLGYRLKDGKHAVVLPGKITCAFLPGSPHGQSLAKLAYEHNKEIMLHLPMEAESGKEMGPVGLSASMSEQTLKRTLHKELGNLPHVRGYNNHMGSYLTGVTSRMRWLMEATMFHNDLYFVDSKTTAHSVAAREADKLGITYTSRDIFLDYERNSDIVKTQLALLLKRAREKGTALAIGHPYPETVMVLQAWLPKLKDYNVRLVHVSELIKIRNQRKSTSWQMSSSPSHKVVKSSKL